MFWTRIFMLIAVALLQGCGGSSSTKTPASTDPIIEQPVPSDEMLLEKISDIFDKPNCISHSGQACQIVDVQFEPAKDWSGENKPRRRILLIDSGFATAAVTGYRNRVLEIYDVQEDMSLEVLQPSITMPKSMDEIYTLIAEHEKFISVDKFKVFHNDTNFKLLQKIEFESGHGYFIGAFLMEHNPDAQMVIMEQGKESWLYAPQEMCSEILSDDSNDEQLALSLIEKRFSQYKESIESTVETHKIDYINASWGASRKSISQIITRACGSTPRDSFISQVLAIDHQFMQDIGSLTYKEPVNSHDKPAILVQAGVPESSETLYESHADYVSDCDSSINNRIRIGSILYEGTDIPRDGSNNNGLLSNNNQQLAECIDVFMPLGQYYENSKPKLREHAMRQIFHGFWEDNSFPTLSSSSMAAPVALSALNYHQSQGAERLKPQALFEMFTRNNIVSDPLQHQQFNVYDLGYRQAESD